MTLVSDKSARGAEEESSGTLRRLLKDAGDLVRTGGENRPPFVDL